MRKHKRLLEIMIIPSMIMISGWKHAVGNAFRPIHPIVGVENETVLGLLSKAMPDKPNIKITPEITLNEPGLIGQKPLIAALDEFARFANSIVQLFDR
jgi:hypothetical protein